MIQRMSHTTIYVLDQEVAKDFYVGKLDFEVKVDQTMPNGFRWLTVSPKGQPGLEIILMKVGSDLEFKKERGGNGADDSKKDIDAQIALLKKGRFNAGAFHTADCRKTYAELQAKGVEFLSAPRDEFYGVEAIMKDPFGNWFSMTQPKNQ